ADFRFFRLARRPERILTDERESALAERCGGHGRDRVRVAAERAATIAIAVAVPEVPRITLEEERPLRPFAFEAEPGVGVLTREAEPELDAISGDAIMETLGAPIVEIAAVEPSDAAPVEPGRTQLIEAESCPAGGI